MTRFGTVPSGAVLIPSDTSRTPAQASPSALYEVFRCSECSALVLRNDIADHDRWHDRLDPAIDRVVYQLMIEEEE